MVEQYDGSDVFAYPATVTRATTSNDELLKLAKKQARDPEIFEEHEPYFWSAVISNNQLDSYFTRMHKTSLQNYAEEAAQGVAFLTGHDAREQALGRSITGTFTGSSGNGVAKVTADFYTLRGLFTNKVPSDEFIKGVRAGIISDVSIGFYGGTFRCTICNNDLWSWDCWHIPGVEYDTLDKNGEKTGEREICTAWVENSHLSEVSAVYDGATPGAAIRKAEFEIREAGQREPEQRVKPENIRILEARYRLRLPSLPSTTVINVNGSRPEDVADMVTERLTAAANRGINMTDLNNVENTPETPVIEGEENTPSVSSPEPEAVREPEDSVIEPPVSPQASVELPPTVSETNPEVPGRAAENNSAPGEEGNGDDDDMERAATALRTAFEAANLETPADPIAEAERIIKDLPRLRRLADMGNTYFKDSVDTAIAEGVRAHGNDFQVETMRATLESLPLDSVKQFQNMWRVAADAILAGGRLTPPDGEPPVEIPPARRERELPDAAFTAG